MKQYTEEQLFDPKVRIEIYEQALKDWHTPWFFKKYTIMGNTHMGFCLYFFRYFTFATLATRLLSFELKTLQTTDKNYNPFWFTGTGRSRKGRRARRKALRQAIQICKQKIKSNEQFS